jgi:hypothetical protein
MTDPEEIELEPAVIERSADSKKDHLVIRILRSGHVVDMGNLSMEHRGEIQVEVQENGKVGGEGHGVGESLNDYSPYSLDVCRYDLHYEVEGELSNSTCILDLAIYEEILGGTCTHFDPNQKLDYPYAAWENFDDIGEFVFLDLGGTDTEQFEKDELVGKIDWVTIVQVWKIRDVPPCESVGTKPAPPPTMEPWPTPTWNP